MSGDRFSANALKNMLVYQPFENLSDRQIEKATRTSGVRIKKYLAAHNPLRIASAEPLLLEFTMRQYYYQDVVYGTCTIKLISSEEFFMLNVVRAVAMCAIINITWPFQRNCISTDK